MKHFSLAVILTMEPKRFYLKETTRSSNREVVEKALVDLPVYADIQLFIEKESTLTW